MCTFKTSPRALENARKLNTCGRFDSTHEGVWDVHGFFPRAKPRHTPHRHTRAKNAHCTPAPTPTQDDTAHHTTTQNTRHTFHAHTTHKHHDTFTRHGKTHQVQTKCVMTDWKFFLGSTRGWCTAVLCWWSVGLVNSVDERDLCLLQMYFVVCCCNSRS